MVPIKNSSKAIEAVEKIMDVEVRKKMSIWNKKKVKNVYSEENIIKKYVDIYNCLDEVE